MSILQEKIDFEQQFCTKTQKLTILTASQTGGAGKAGINKLWIASQNVIAFIDETGQFHQKSVRLEWQIQDTKNKIFYFYGHKIYQVLVRPKITNADKNDKEYLCFMLVDVIEKTHNQSLENFLQEYLKPITLQYKNILFELNKEYHSFEGYGDFLNHQINIELYCDDYNTHKNATANTALNTLDNITNNQKRFDALCKKFACHELLKNAQDWQQDKSKPLITETEFINCIHISSLILYQDGGFEVFYHDGDIFFGHVIIIYGQMLGDFSNILLQDATIAG